MIDCPSTWLVCATGLLLVLCASVAAEEHPIYTTVDAAKADEYEAAVERVMAMSEEEMLSFLPDGPAIRMCECPNCYGGAEGNGIFTWTIDRPDELTCRYCETVISLPDARYPETQTLVGQNALGEEIAIPYYLNEERNATHFLSGHVAIRKRAWLLGQVNALGKAWRATDKPEYARRVLLVLDEAATRYPHYPAVHNRHVGVRFCKSQEPPYPWDAGRWGNFHDEIPRALVTAYDLIYDSDQFDALAQERGYDVRAHIEDDLFRPTYVAIEVSPYHVSNVVGYDITSAAMMGRVLGDPMMVHGAFGWMMRNLEEGFFRDGTWHESASYHYMTLGGLRKAFSVVKGYSDPEGYVDEADGRRFDDLDPLSAAPFWGKVQDAYKLVAYPDGTSAAFHDTWAHQKRAEPLETSVPAILPGFGHASLGWGSGADQLQAQLHFSGAYGHAHRDVLSMSLWAAERDILPDLGYTWTDMRWWNVSSHSHNLVVVDRAEQATGRSDGDLLAWFPAADERDISVIDVDGKRAYANIEGLDMYRRLLMLVPVSETNAYVVDISRTRGGTVHDWLLHGSADEDMTAACSLDLAPAGAEFAGDEPPKTYALWRDVQSASTDGGFAVTFACAAEPERGVRTHIVGTAPTELFVGETPSIRQAGVGSRGDNRKTLDFWMPHMAARRTGEGPLQSTFAAIEEPFLGEPFIDAVTRLDVAPADEGCVALQVTCGAITDTIISTLDEEPFPARTVGDVTLRGRLGVVRRVDGRVTGTWLFEGRELTVGGEGIATDRASFSGAITGATRIVDGAETDALLTDADLPAGDELRGSWVIVTYASGYRQGYEIDRIEAAEGGSAIVLTDDPALRIDGETTKEIYFPRRTIEGVSTFEIPLSATMAQD